MFLNYAATRKRPEDDLADTMDASDISEALKDLDEGIAIGKRGRNSGYWPRIRERLIENSSTEDVDEAVREWESDGLPFISRGSCELCDKTPIKYHFPIQNRVTQKKLVVGCECIHNYLIISGYEAPEALKKKLVAQLNLLKKQEAGGGGATEDDLHLLEESFSLESKVRRVIGAIAGGEPDLDINEYEESLYEVVYICNTLGIKNSLSKAGSDAHIAARKISRKMDAIRVKQKFVGNGLGVLASTIMAKRKPSDKVEALAEYLNLLNDLANFGPASEVIARTWGAVAERKESLLTSVQRKCDKGKNQLTEDYRFECDLVRPYSNLSSVLEAGLKAQRDLFDSQLSTVRNALEKEDFLEQLRKESSVVSQALHLDFYPDLSNSDGNEQKAAYNVGQFAEFVGKGGFKSVQFVIEQVYDLENETIRDVAGVKVALFRAADDSIIDADVMGAKAVNAFEDLIRSKERRALDLVEQEVDEIAELVQTAGNLKVFEKMSRDLGIDVQKVFKLYTNDPKFEGPFCKDIFERWESGRLRSLSPAQMGNIKRQQSMKGYAGEVKNSMWKALQSKLTARYSILK
jgi:hypothetical protein